MTFYNWNQYTYFKSVLWHFAVSRGIRFLKRTIQMQSVIGIHAYIICMVITLQIGQNCSVRHTIMTIMRLLAVWKSVVEVVYHKLHIDDGILVRMYPVDKLGRTTS